MKSIKEQIIEAKKEKREREEEMWFVDYCNNCKTGLASKVFLIISNVLPLS